MRGSEARNACANWATARRHADHLPLLAERFHEHDFMDR